MGWVDAVGTRTGIPLPPTTRTHAKRARFVWTPGATKKDISIKSAAMPLVKCLIGMYMGYAAWETPGSGLNAKGIVTGMSQTLGPFKIVTSSLVFMLTTGLGPFAEDTPDEDVFYYNDMGMALFESFFFWVLNDLWYVQASHRNVISTESSHAYARPWSHSRKTIASRQG